MEALIATEDHPNGDWQAGDIIVVKPDGSPWGRKEINPDGPLAVVRLPDDADVLSRISEREHAVIHPYAKYRDTVDSDGKPARERVHLSERRVRLDAMTREERDAATDSAKPARDRPVVPVDRVEIKRDVVRDIDGR